MSAPVAKLALSGVLLVCVTMVAYVPAMGSGFIWDDNWYVTNNPELRTVSGLGDIWFKIGAVPQYYPLVHTTFWVEYHLWGLNPLGYHVVNVSLHAISALLVWTVLRRLDLPWALLAGAIFALHPVHVESVAWITERKNVLSGLFYLLAWSAYLRFDPLTNHDPAGPNRRRYYALALVLFVCALLSKTVTASLPAAVLLLIWWKRGRLQRRDLIRLLPFFAVGIALAAVTVWMEAYNLGGTGTGASGEEWDFSAVERGLIAGRAVWFYAAKLLWPTNLIFIYPRWQIDSGLWWQYLFPVAALLAVAVLWRLRRRVGRGPLVAVLFFGGTLVPALGFFNVYPFRYSFVADHFQYLASLGLIAWFAGTVGRLVREYPLNPPWAVPVAGVILVGALALLSWRQQRVYKDLNTLWTDTLAKNPDCWMAHNNLGTVLIKQGQIGPGVAHCREALRLNPGFAEAHVNVGLTLVRQGRMSKAITHLRAAVELDPDRAEVRHNLALGLAAAGRTQGAIDQYRRALQLAPNFAAAHLNLGNLLRESGRIDEAVAHYQQVLQLQPGNVAALCNLAAARATLGQIPQAIEHLERALEINPQHPGARQLLNTLLSRQRGTDERAPE